MHLADHIRKQSLFTDKARKLHPTGVRIQRKAGIWCSLVLVGDPADDCADVLLAYSVGEHGLEFERSVTGRGSRTEVYYCHPYRPSERGSNENQNGLIRRHLPKGTDLSTISYEETKRIEDWLNNYPRKMFGYLCSEQLFREEIALILAS